MPRVKRKAQQLDADKRQCLTWNMYDAAQEQQTDIPSTSSSQQNTDAHEADEEIIVDDPASMCVQQVVEIRDIPHGALTHPSDNSQRIEDSSSLSPRKMVFPSPALPLHHISYSEYNTIMNSAKYAIQVHDRIPSEDLLCHLGDIKFSLLGYRTVKDPDTNHDKISDVSLPRFLPEGKFSLFVGASVSTTFIIFDIVDGNQENVYYWSKSSASSYMCLRGCVHATKQPSQFDALEHLCRLKKGKVIKLLLKEYKKIDATLTFSVCLMDGALFTPKFAAESNLGRSPQVQSMLKLMSWIKGYDLPDSSYVKPRQQDFNQLFESLREAHKPWYETKEVWDFQHPALIPQLRPYQTQAVKWMTEKENYQIGGDIDQDKHKDGEEQESKLHILWHKVSVDGEENVYYNSHSGQFTKYKFVAPPRIPGGILADEMGLGKTVEVLACILAHPRPGFSQDHLHDTVIKTDEGNGEQLESTDPNVDSRPGSSQDHLQDTVIKTDEGNGERLESTDPDVDPKPGSTQSHLQDLVKTDEGNGREFKLTSPDVDLRPESSQDHLQDLVKTDEGKDDDGKEGSGEKGRNDEDQRTSGKQDGQSQSTEHGVDARTESDGGKTESDRDKTMSNAGVNDTCNTVSDANTNEIGATENIQQGTSTETLSGHIIDSRTVGESSTESVEKSKPCSVCTSTLSECETVPKSASDSTMVDEFSTEKPISVCNSTLPVGETCNEADQRTPNVKMELPTEDTSDTHSVAGSDVTVAYYSDETSASDQVSTVKSESETVNVPVADCVENTARTSDHSVSSVESKSVVDTDTKEEPPPLICVSKGQFQCICGMQEVWVDSTKCVKCVKCNVWQHMKCVNFDFDHGDTTVYLCPHCCIALKAVASKATLIVSPTAICHQWVDEINRHVNSASLRVLVYRGVKKHGFLQPRDLANHDIVITTYDTLRTELNYVDLPHTNSDTSRRLRHAKRYMAVPSPLPAVDWWRICLDEAQMVECPTAKVAEMALRLTGVNRWCVTGTPIQRDLDDLYGLFLFLGVEPYWVRKWWDQMLYKPYCRGNQEPMKKALAEVLWRSAKKDVLQQIDIPAQTEEVHWLKFSPVEAHFYKRKREDCTHDFSYVVSRLRVDPSAKLKKMDRVSAKKLLFPLLRLRQACCHPQAVRGEFLPLQKNTMTMAELLKSLTTKTKMECEESHRLLVCALNGQAAVHLMKDEPVEAVNKYREVLFSAEEQKDKLKTDSLQRLHAMHNLWELLQTKPDGVAPTTRDDQLQQQMQEIRDGYMAKNDAFVGNALKTLEPIHQKMTELNSNYDPECPWWLDGLVWARHQGYDEELVLRVKNELSSGAESDDFMNFCNRFKDVRGLQFVLNQQLDSITEYRQTVCSKLEELTVPIDQTTLAKCIDCHLRPTQGKKKNNCDYCKLDRTLVEYEMRLFSFKERDLIDIEHTNQDDIQYGLNRPRGTWAASNTERALRVVQVFMRQVGGDSLMLEYSNVHMQYLEQQKKEFKLLRAVYVALRDRVAALDELEMATMRLRLRGEEEEKDKTTQPYIIELHELDQQWQKLLNDQVVAKHDLRRKLGQLVYLENLAKSEDQSGGENPEPCPICARELGNSWSVLTCGHCYCKDCIEILMKRHWSGRFRCPICRTLTAHKEISYVSTVTQEQEEEDGPGSSNGLKLKGSHSTKVEAVVKALIQIRQADPNAKALVFSTWVDVLEIIGRALRDNKVEYRSISQPGHRLFQTNLMDFKQEPGITALLIPIQTGSHGLNIIEATHVLLVEPILNPASELQAVGRVHRIGQTKPTVVHRFLVRDTIEERLQALLSANPASASMDNVVESDTGDLTLADLQQLFSGSKNHPSIDLTSDQGDQE